MDLTRVPALSYDGPQRAGTEPPGRGAHMGIEDRRAREFQRREQDILSAALNLAGTESWQAVTIDQIAEKAEIGKGTVYKHFKSKDEVCARLVMDNGRVLLAKLRAVDPGLEYVPRLKAALRTVWHHSAESRDMRSLGMYCEMSEHSLNLGAEMEREFWGVKGEIEAYFQALVEEGITRGIIPGQPIGYLLAAGWSTMIGASRLFQESNMFPHMQDDEEFLEYLVDYVLKGLMNAQVPGRAN